MQTQALQFPMQPADFILVRAVALEGSVGRNGGSITILNATLVQDAEFCRGDSLWIETTTASATSTAIRDDDWFRIPPNFVVRSMACSRLSDFFSCLSECMATFTWGDAVSRLNRSGN